MVNRIPESDSFGKMRAAAQDTARRLDDIERTDGSQYARTLEKIKSLVSGLSDQVQAYINTFSMTTAAITAYVSGLSWLSVLAPAKGGTGTSNVYSTTATGAQLAVYVKPDGGLTVGASSERFKRNIADWLLDVDALMLLAPRLFEWRDFPGVVDVGLIAEEAYALGLHWLVRFDGPVIEGIRYERLPVALLAVARQQQSRIEELEGTLAGVLSRLAALEGA